MNTLTQIVYVTVKLILEAYYYLLFARAILSWLPIDGGKITRFIYGVTELVLAPVRSLLERFTGRMALPIDLSFTVVFILITILLNIM